MTGADIAIGADPPILEVMSMRKMRRLKPDPVPDELLTKLVEAATWAPSGSNAHQFSGSSSQPTCCITMPSLTSRTHNGSKRSNS